MEAEAASGPVSELLARASTRQRVFPGDARGGSVFTRVSIDGQDYFLKRCSRSGDWITRLSGDRVHRPFVVWRAGVMDRVPACIDHTVVAMEVAGEGEAAELLMLMRDVAPHRARLPEPKEAAIERYRRALERAGITTEAWFEAQLDLCLVGMMAAFAWEKALGEADELRWWEARAGRAVRRQGLRIE